jgi:hypothetical protein
MGLAALAEEALRDHLLCGQVAVRKRAEEEVLARRAKGAIGWALRRAV